MRLRTVIKYIFRKFGFEVLRMVPPIPPVAGLMATLRKFDINLVLDVGANKGLFAPGSKTLDAVAGQYMREARALFLKIDAQSFEWQVLDSAREILPQAGRGTRMQSVHFRLCGVCA